MHTTLTRDKLTILSPLRMREGECKGAHSGTKNQAPNAGREMIRNLTHVSNGMRMHEWRKLSRHKWKVGADAHARKAPDVVEAALADNPAHPVQGPAAGRSPAQAQPLNTVQKRRVPCTKQH